MVDDVSKRDPTTTAAPPGKASQARFVNVTFFIVLVMSGGLGDGTVLLVYVLVAGDRKSFRLWSDNQGDFTVIRHLP